MSNPLVSVVIPNYNHSPYLVQRIESVLNQTFQDFDVIILDDCSTDNSKEIIERYKSHPKVRQIEFNTNNSGSTFKQWHKGISLSKAEYIWIAESDDFADLDFLQKSVKCEADFIFARIIDVDLNGKILESAKTWLKVFEEIDWDSDQFFDGKAFFEILKQRCIIANASSMIFRKKFFESHYSKIREMKYCGDWLFYLHSAINGATFQYLAESVSYFRQHAITTRWQNKDIIKPLEERFVCLNFIEIYTKQHSILNADLIQHIANLSIFQILKVIKNRPALVIQHIPYFYFALLLKIRIKFF